MITNPNPTPSGSSIDQIMKMTLPTSGSGGVRGVFGSILGGLGNIVMPGLGGVIGGAIKGGALAASMPTLGSDTTQYLMLQNQIQNETLAYETASTVLKMRHDVCLHAIQNMK